MKVANVPVPAGVSTKTLWDRLVKTERSNTKLKAKGTKGGGLRLGNPFTVMELVTYGGTSFGLGMLEGKGILPKTVSLGRTAIDTRLLGSGVLVAAEFVKPVKAMLDRFVPKKYRGALILGMFIPWSYDAGRSVGSSF